ncbi:MAG: metallophosphoesterase [Candidatus Izimaplasma sp.]|nr:metallophosphoesterase [Candidatus Izimaplasma bacterium]
MEKFFVMSDIHSEYDMMITALKEKGFEEDNNNHKIIIVGDILDRGDQGHKLIVFIGKLIEADRIQGVLGNHDQFLIDFLDEKFKAVGFNIRYNGFGKTVKLVSDEVTIYADKLKYLPKKFKKKYPLFSSWVKKLPLYLEFQKHIFVHGALNFKLNNFRNTPRKFATWKFQKDISIPKRVKQTIVVGHLPTINFSDNRNGDIIAKENLLMIDGGATYGGKMNVHVIKGQNL